MGRWIGSSSHASAHYTSIICSSSSSLLAHMNISFGPHTQATQYYFDDVQTAFRIGVNDFPVSACVCVSSKWTFSEVFLLCAEWGQTTPFCLWWLKEALNRFVTKPPIGRAIQVADVRDEWPVWRFFFGLLLTHARAHTDLIDSDHLHRSFYLHCSAVLVANKAPSTKLTEPIFFKGFATSKNLRTGTYGFRTSSISD